MANIPMVWLNTQFTKSQYPLHLVSYLDYNLIIRPFSATYSRHIVRLTTISITLQTNLLYISLHLTMVLLYGMDFLFAYDLE